MALSSTNVTSHWNHWNTNEKDVETEQASGFPYYGSDQVYCLDSETNIPNPAIRAFRNNKAMIQRAIDRKCEGIFTARSNFTSATQNNNGNHENRRPNVDSIVYYGKRSRPTEEFQSLLSPLKVVDHKTFKKGKKEKKFFSLILKTVHIVLR